MAHKFKEHLWSLFESDPLCKAVPKYTNRKNIKSLQKEAEDRGKFLDKYADSKRLSLLVPLLNEKINTLKSLAERFESVYNEHSVNSSTLDARRQTLAQQEKALDGVEKVKLTLASEVETLKQRITKLEADQNSESIKYAEGKQGELEAEFGRQKEMVHERETTLKQNEVLKEKMGLILKDIQTQSDNMDKDYEDKRAEVSSSKLKNISSFDMCKKELDKKGEYEGEIAEATAFTDRVQPSLTKIEDNVQEYEKLFNNSVKDFEKPLKKVEKIKKENIALRKASEEVTQKLAQNNLGIAGLAAENLALRARIQREEKQRAMLARLAEDLEKKIKESQN